MNGYNKFLLMWVTTSPDLLMVKEEHHVLSGKSSETLRQTRPSINTESMGSEMIKSDLMGDHESVILKTESQHNRDNINKPS